MEGESMARYVKRTREESAELRETRMSEANARLEAGIRDLLVDDGAWKRFLNFQSKIHDYSFGNTMLIRMQCPEATYVMPYGAKDGRNGWKSVGRHVKAGEHGIWILAPFSGKRTEENERGEREEQKFTYFQPVTVFDVSQTEGEPIPKPDRSVPLEGDSPELRDLYASVAGTLEADGWKVRREASDNPRAGGSSDPATRTVRVNPGGSDAKALSTLLHEAAHVRHGHCDDRAEYAQHRGVMEAEAESTAYLVLATIGVDSSQSTLPYIAGWSDGDANIVRKVGERVVKVARAIADAIEGTEQEAETV